MLFDRGLHLSLAALVAEACKGHGLKKADHAKVESEVLDFLRQRLAGMLTTEGLRSDVVDAALAGTFDDPLIAKEKVRALDAWRTSDEYRPLVTALKRAGNIVPKDFSGAVKKGLLKEEAEKDLFTAYMDIKDLSLIHI